MSSEQACVSPPCTPFKTPPYPRDQNHEARHRYSEFESLRTHLVKLYPTLIIPPIPSKNTIGDYAVKQGKAKEDTVLIARRKRMLQTFLNRIARHPILSNERVFHRFLDGEVSWVCRKLRITEGIPPIDCISGTDGGFELSPYNPLAQKYSQSPFTQSYGPRSISRLSGASEPLTYTPVAQS